MKWIMACCAAWLLLAGAALSGNAQAPTQPTTPAVAPNSTATVVLKLQQSSPYSLALLTDTGTPVQKLEVKGNDLAVPLRLTFSFAPLPQGYARDAAARLYFRDFQPAKLNQGDLQAQLTDVRMAVDDKFTNDPFIADLVNDPTSAKLLALRDQSFNVQQATGYVGANVNLSEMLATITVANNITLSARDAHWLFEIWEVSTPDDTTKQPIKLRMMTVKAYWDIQIPFQTLRQNTQGTLLNATVTVPKHNAGDGTEAAPKPDDQESSEASRVPNAPPGAQSVSAVVTLFQPFGLGVAQIAQAAKSPGFDVVGGFAVRNNGQGALVGVNANFADMKSRPRWWPDERLGVTAGLSTGDGTHIVLGPTYKIGSRAYLFAGFDFATIGGNTRSSPTFGLTFSLGDLINSVTGNTPAPAPADTITTAEVSIEDASFQEPIVARRASQEAVVLVRSVDDGLILRRAQVYSDPPVNIADLNFVGTKLGFFITSFDAGTTLKYVLCEDETGTIYTNVRTAQTPGAWKIVKATIKTDDSETDFTPDPGTDAKVGKLYVISLALPTAPPSEGDGQGGAAHPMVRRDVHAPPSLVVRGAGRRTELRANALNQLAAVSGADTQNEAQTAPERPILFHRRQPAVAPPTSAASRPSAATVSAASRLRRNGKSLRRVVPDKPGAAIGAISQPLRGYVSPPDPFGPNEIKVTLLSEEGQPIDEKGQPAPKPLAISINKNGRFDIPLVAKAGTYTLHFSATYPPDGASVKKMTTWDFTIKLAALTANAAPMSRILYELP